MINPQWLRSFACVSAHGSFTRAAESLSLTQAAVSHHIRNLESEYGQLLVRYPRQLELTPAGHALLQYHQELIGAEKRLQSRLVEQDVGAGVISITSPGSIGLTLYPLLLDWQQQHPQLAIRYRFAPDVDVIEAVLDNRYELGLVTRKPDDPKLAAEAFCEEALELVVPKGAQVSQWQDLVALGFIDHPDGYDMATRLLARVFPGNAGVRCLPDRGFVNQVGLILEPVARGMGFTVLPRYAREAFGRQQDIDVVALPQRILDTLWLIHRAEWPLSARAEGAINWLRAQVE